MPVVVKISCSCGSKDGWRIDGDTGECWDCEAPAPRELAVPHIGGRMWNNGDGDSGGRYIKQAGRRFHSEREMQQWADSEGLDIVSATDTAWTRIREDNRKANDAEAQDRGYSDSEDQDRDIRTNQREMVAANRQKKIDAYHDEHGSEGKESVEGATFGALT